MTTTIACTDADGRLLETITRPTEVPALKQALRRWPNSQRQVVLEQGEQAYWLANQLATVAERVRICDPTANAAISGPGDKNDALDAHRLAQLLRLGATKELYRPPLDERLLLRRQFAYYQRATRELTKQIQYMKSQCRCWGIRIRKRAGYSQAKARQWMEQAPEQVRPDLRRLVEQIEDKKRWKQTAWDRVQQTGAAFWEIDQFRRIPGLGPVRSHGLSAYIMDPHRFRSASALFKYSRLAVQRRSSGGDTVAPAQLNRAGHGPLKALTDGAVRSAVHHQKESNEVADYYQASLQRTGGDANKARLNTQRKLLKTCWGLWKTNTDYNPELFCSGAG